MAKKLRPRESKRNGETRLTKLPRLKELQLKKLRKDLQWRMSLSRNKKAEPKRSRKNEKLERLP